VVKLVDLAPAAGSIRLRLNALVAEPPLANPYRNEFFGLKLKSSLPVLFVVTAPANRPLVDRTSVKLHPANPNEQHSSDHDNHCPFSYCHEPSGLSDRTKSTLASQCRVSAPPLRDF
jgi:hypothetical protein